MRFRFLGPRADVATAAQVRAARGLPTVVFLS